MKKMIQGYETSCEKVMKRIHQLTQQRNELRKNGNDIEIDDLDLERRIRILYTEHCQMQEIVTHLTQYMRRIDKSVETR